jgi:glycosyltransferase involved in cell wall biosynthesis
MSSPLKILHIISSWQSGVGNELAEFAARASRENLKNAVCVLAGSHRRHIPDVPIRTLYRRWQFDVGAYVGVARMLRQFRPDIVHAWDSTALAYSAFFLGSHRVLAERRDADAPSGRWQQYIDYNTHRFIVPRSKNDCPKSVVIPQAAVPVPHVEPMIAEELLAKLDFPLVEPSGDYYPVLHPQYDPVRRNYTPMVPHATPFLIGVVLPLCTEHRILDALWVFETLNYVHLNFHVFIMGDGKDREVCLRYRDRWKLFSRVHFLGHRHDTHRLVPHFDVLLHLSSSVEHSGTILSAMSCGVPVIALETPESREYILDGTTGILIPAEGDFRFYRRTATKRLLYLLENKELRRSMCHAAREHVEKKFNFDTAVQRRIELYREVAFAHK